MSKHTCRSLLDDMDILVDAYEELSNLSASSDGASVAVLLNILAIRLRMLHGRMEETMGREGRQP